MDFLDVPKDYHDFPNVFSKAKADTLAPHQLYDLKITLKNGKEPSQPLIYLLLTLELKTLWKFLDEHLNIGFIWPSWSSYGAPILFIKKKDGLLWLCVDFHALNKVTKKDCYLLPFILDLLDVPWKAWIYSKIDLCHMYHLVWITKGGEWKIVFKTRYSSYEWLVMPFGLNNSPATFQCFMNDILGDLLDKCIMVYLDDILLYSNNLKEHKEHIYELLWHLRKHSLYTKANKCEWHRDSVEFLGYILTNLGLTMAEEKVKIIQEWPEPRNIKDIQSFLGFANFYRQFIHNYSEITVPLTWLTWKGTTWNFTLECHSTFELLKKVYISALILMHWIPDQLLVVETDISDYALAAILSMYNPDSEIHPIAFHSWTFSSAELNYDVHDKELLAIYEAFRCWWHYLEGPMSLVDVVTHHKNLEYFTMMKLLMWWQVW